MPGTYTLELELLGTYMSAMPVLEIYEDGALNSSHSVSSSGTSISVTINYGGALPTSLEFRFLNDAAEGGRTIEIQSVKIDERYVNTNNYLTTDSLTSGASATVDVVTADFLFDDSDPAGATFTTGATQTYTTGIDIHRDPSGTTDEVFDMLAGRDTAYLGSGNDTVSGGDGNDTLRGGGGNDLLFGDTGNDRLYGEDGDDTLYGGDGNDRIHGDDGHDEIYGGIGDDRLNGNDGNDTILGGAGADRLNGGTGNDYLFGGADDDILTGAAGADTLDGGAGVDLLFGGAGIDHLNGGDGNDILYGNDGNDILNGDDGNDTLYGLSDNDTLRGGAGNDLLVGGNARVIDTTQQVTYGGAQDGAGTVTQFTGGMTLDGNLWKQINGNFRITANTILEFDFRSTQEAEVSGIGFDTDNNISAGTTFELWGTQNWGIQAFNNYDGSGDWVHYKIDVGSYFTGSYSSITFVNDDDGNSPNDGAPLGNGSFANITIYESTITADTDTLEGGSGDDQLLGNLGIDTINGGEGADNISGQDDNDILFGDEGDDTIHGGDGVDAIEGGSDNDTINGNDGNDTIYGDGSSDRDQAISDILTANPSVVYSAASDSFYQLVTTNANHTTARSNAMSTTINGVGGYLANITSAAENNFIDNLIVADTWIGGTDSGAEGVWIWQDGAEAGEQFWAGDQTGSSVGGFYENWAGGEPNDFGSGEDHVTIRTNGTWNDLVGTAGRDYIIEWDAESVLNYSSGDDVLNGGDGDDTIYGDSASFATVTASQGWLYEYYDLASSPTTLATAGFTLSGGADNSNTATSTGITQQFEPTNFDGGDNFALKYTTTLTVTTAGTYTFRTTSDDGSALFLDGVQIVDNDGLHGSVTVTSAGQVLAAGTYTLEATYFERTGGDVMNVEMSGPDTASTFVTLESYAGATVTARIGSSADGDDIITGGDGVDTLYGGGGADTFIFEAAHAFTDNDILMDFSTVDGDILDISDIVTGFSGTITDYVQFTNSGGDTLVQVDANGLTGGTNFQTIATIDGLTNLDEDTLYTNGNIVV